MAFSLAGGLMCRFSLPLRLQHPDDVDEEYLILVEFLRGESRC